MLSSVVIPPWCQDTSRRRASNATTTTPVGNASSIKDEHWDVLKRVGVQEWPVTSANGLRGCLDGASLSITGSTRTWKWALMLCPLQFPSEASFLNNKLSHSLHYNHTLEGKKCGYTGISHINAKWKQATYLQNSVEGRQEEGERRGGPMRNSFVIHFFADHRFFHAFLKSFFEDAARTSGRYSVMLVVTALPHLVGNLRCLAAHIIERGSEWQVRVVMRELLPESAGMCRDPALHKVPSFKDLLQTQLQCR